MPLTLPPISRRRFLQGSLAAAGGLLLPSCSNLQTPASNTDPNRLALLSDIHLNADKTLLDKTNIRMWDHFQQATREILALSPRPAGVLINGDCAHLLGRPSDYATVLDGVHPLRAAGLPVHLALGNHDSRENLHQAFSADDRQIRDLPDRRVMRLALPHADWYMLDSLEKTNSTPGLLGPDQLAWLEKSLDSRPQRPAIVMLHHHPDTRTHRENFSGLTDTPALLNLLQPRKQVKAVVFGHTHAWKHYQEDGLHFINLPTTAYVFNPKQPAGWVDARLSPTGLTLQLHALTPNHPQDKELLHFPWRA